MSRVHARGQVGRYGVSSALAVVIRAAMTLANTTLEEERSSWIKSIQTVHVMSAMSTSEHLTNKG